MATRLAIGIFRLNEFGSDLDEENIAMHLPMKAVDSQKVLELVRRPRLMIH